MSASEASRHSSAVPDEAEETVLVTGNGRAASTIGPAPRAGGRAVLDVFRRRHGRPGLDAEFEASVAAARDAVSGTWDEDPWRG
ncbi:type II toxin-antitoxin system Phd/YefM family antitoxin [Saccharothrix yanglingensis]|uniref:Prevent-host-death family protein n=1 Tax=Saccharothrix yanglingensis TaxID=659496 RepID=A0ABU0WXP8_9PSEU|nr:type II toxin-antitoxin system Phd/YefM family antitoxin [Saccharothrix yanglingensis]MDQ2584619.1 prevent-host-death family protein [Saccharothrix yanglingensis]